MESAQASRIKQTARIRRADRMAKTDGKQKLRPSEGDIKQTSKSDITGGGGGLTWVKLSWRQMMRRKEMERNNSRVRRQMEKGFLCLMR